MHELSIATALVETVVDAARAARATRVRSVRVLVGALSGVEPGALSFCYEAVVEGTLLEGSTLDLVTEPVVIYCERCAREVTLPGVQSMACPDCGTPSPWLRGGRELQIETIEIDTDDPGPEGGPA